MPVRLRPVVPNIITKMIHFEGPVNPKLRIQHKNKWYGLQIVDYFGAESPTLSLFTWEAATKEWGSEHVIMQLSGIEPEVKRLGGVENWVKGVLMKEVNNHLAKLFPAEPGKIPTYPVPFVQEIDRILHEKVTFKSNPDGTLRVSYK